MVDSLDSMHLCSWRLHFVENISEAEHVTALCDVSKKIHSIMLLSVSTIINQSW